MNKIANYYIGKYGVPSRKAVFRSPDGREIEIYKWAVEKTDEGVTMYATLGASNHLGDVCEGCEFFIGITPEVDEIAEALAEVALHGVGGTKIPGCGDSVTMAYPLWKGTEAKSFLFTDGSEILEPLHLQEKTISFIQLVPLFDSELAFKKNNGESRLWEVFESMRVPYWDSSRKSAL